MNILVLTPGIFPDRHSGLPKMVYHLSREIARAGNRVVVLTRQYHPSHPTHEQHEGMEYHRIRIPKRGDTLHPLWPVMTALRSRTHQKKLKRQCQEFDLLWVHNPWWIFLQDPRDLWPLSKIVYDFHSDATGEMIHNYPGSLVARTVGGIYDRVIHSALIKAKAIVVHSHYTRDRCLRIGGPGIAQKLHLIPGGVDPEVHNAASPSERSALRRQKNLPTDGRPVFLTVRGLKPRTGVDKLVEAAALLKKEGVPFFLTIVGRGVMKEKIERQIEQRGLAGSIRLVSTVGEEALAEYYRASDVFVLPTQGAEGFGLATLEALASGLIVLGTNNSATPEILKLYNDGWLIDGTDPATIFRKMKQFCQNPNGMILKTDQIRKITLENFSWRRSAEKLAEIFGKAPS